MPVKPTKKKRRATRAPAESPALREARASLAVLWRSGPAATRGPKAALTLDDLANAGIAIADANGLAAVSMSRVAEAVGVTTMALYRYVPGKTELIDLMFDTAMGEPPDLAAIGGGWRPQIEHWARSLWDLVLAHPWALEVLLRLRLPGPNELAWMERGAHALAGARLTGAPLLDMLFLIVGQVRTVAQYAVAGPGVGERLGSADWAIGVSTLLADRAAQFPTLVAAAQAGAFGADSDPLAFGLARLLDGIERYV